MSLTHSQRVGLVGAFVLLALIISKGVSRNGLPPFLANQLATLEEVFPAHFAAPVEVPALCGNAAINLGEQCDDGNAGNGDGCSAACSIEYAITSTPLPASIFRLSRASRSSSSSASSGLYALALMIGSVMGIAYVRRKPVSEN